MNTRVLLCGLLLAAVGFSACDKKETPKEAPKPSAVAPSAAPVGDTVKSSAPEALLHPEKATEKAPDTFKAKFETTKGSFVITVHRDWAPLGADRFYNLVKIGYFSDVAFFRAIEGFMVQLGIHGLPEVNTKWRAAQFPDDPMASKSNKRGFVTFAKGGPNSRTTQFFINFTDNSRLDPMGFPPFGEVTEGMNVVDSLNKEYGEGMPSGRGPNQGRVQNEGNTYLRAEFPRLDYVKSATIQ
jgi:peptidyl-prolyl cis-trans isomerase A (cyclophilin A)